MIFEGFAPVKIKIVGLLGEGPNSDMIEKVCIFMCNFLAYTAAINKNFGVLLIRTSKHTTSFKLSARTFFEVWIFHRGCQSLFYFHQRMHCIYIFFNTFHPVVRR
jgi:hypothetical protein